MNRLAPILRYPGAKHRVAPWIVSHFPKHRIYCEPFMGSLSVLFAKPRTAVEVVNDTDGRIVNLFRVLRDQPEALIRAITLTPFARDEFRDCLDRAEEPVEDARRILVGCWQSVGGLCSSRTGWKFDTRPQRPGSLVWAKLPARLAAAVERLQGVQIEHRDGIGLLSRLSEPDILHYLDPPYPAGVRRRQLYVEEMSEETDHLALLAAARRHSGPVLISCYDNPLYRDSLPDWHLRRIKAFALTGEAREECLWLNAAAGEGLQKTMKL